LSTSKQKIFGVKKPSPVGEGGPRRGSPKTSLSSFRGFTGAVDEANAYTA